jgi:hypothetical protein
LLILGKKVKQTKSICCGDVYVKLKNVGRNYQKKIAFYKGHYIFTGGEAIYYKLLKINLENFCDFYYSIREIK